MPWIAHAKRPSRGLLPYVAVLDGLVVLDIIEAGLADAPPRRVRVVGIQPRSIQLGLELSAEVAAGVPALVEAVHGYLVAWQTEDVAPA